MMEQRETDALCPCGSLSSLHSILAAVSETELTLHKVDLTHMG